MSVAAYPVTAVRHCVEYCLGSLHFVLILLKERGLHSYNTFLTYKITAYSRRIFRLQPRNLVVKRLLYFKLDIPWYVHNIVQLLQVVLI